ncbi:MAG: ferredoxin:glutaredoxin reductase [Euryarchaeota archaeon]|nr:ferredoxin:glutaredoxin reductase [Euryarchaeota archaeon]
MSEAEELLARLDREARAGGYLLNPEREDTLSLCEGLLTNARRYGYRSCPCRAAAGRREEDSDIICPCDYRDPDLNDFGACYCALYVTKEWIERRMERKVVPERRPPRAERLRAVAAGAPAGASGEAPAGTTAGPALKGKCPVWRCKVCGYLCARDEPPNVCPICKVSKDRFERFA